MRRTYSDSDLECERRYRVAERLAILCGSALPTPTELDMANKEANEAVQQLKHYGQKTDSTNFQHLG